MTIHFSTVLADIRSEQDTHPKQTEKRASDFCFFSYPRTFKRLLDVSLVVIGLPVVLPLVAMAAILVALDGHNPFYSQLRAGKNGRQFRLWKLRTMVHNADALLERCLTHDPAARKEWNETQKLKNDPRITFVGQFLRKSSMDELPQLLNVLKGEMSLVGPRPMMISQQASYPGQSYYALHPGITGLWQVSERNDCDFRDRVHYDDRYYQEISFREDVRILRRTIGVVMKATGY